ncbi:MAG: hypothetical protein LBC95_00300 [Candidatus Nomurabacteria bacterium]|jgi:uncharacterized protein YjeT (DUF2065 family)|nr:hypothetical protein [Candidatus Nomurabacteria bacterium]
MVQYSFSIVWLIVGVLVMALGALITRFYNKFAEATGMWSYSRWRLIGLVAVGVGLIVMTNLHSLILSFIVSLIVPVR